MMFVIVPTTPVAGFSVNTRTQSREKAEELAAQESEYFGVPHRVVEEGR
jgi:uncharacterized NAD-dependent epimerase/dehydratase family protein